MNQNAKAAVLKVWKGRGFVIKGERQRYVLTAAHCLPSLPLPFSDSKKLTYRKLIGPLGSKTTVWAECAFVDPVADIAILSCPDGQLFYKQADAFEKLVGEVQPFEIAAIPGARNAAEAMQGGISAQLLSLKHEWFDCKVSCIRNGPLWIRNAAQPITGGMSGSPVINEKGAAIGMLCTAGGTARGTTKEHTEGGPNPRLTNSLPGWLIGELLRRTSSLKLKEPI